MTSLTKIGVLWALVNLTTFLLLVFGTLSPVWIVNTSGGKGQRKYGPQATMGLITRCNYIKDDETTMYHDTMNDDEAGVEGGVENGVEGKMRHSAYRYNRTSQSRYGHPRVGADNNCGIYTSLHLLPSLLWQVIVCFSVLSSILQLFISTVTLSSLCVRGVVNRRVCTVFSVVHAVVGFQMLAVVLLYPLNWSTNEVRSICGQGADIYSLGTCKVHWGYYCTMSGTALTFLSAVLSNYAVKPKHKTTKETPTLLTDFWKTDDI